MYAVGKLDKIWSACGQHEIQYTQDNVCNVTLKCVRSTIIAVEKQ
jgi:hypothetical protein